MTGPVRILIVDDDRDTLQLVELVLRSAGLEVVRAENGREALERLAADLPALVLCDVLMPEMDGFETLVRIRNDPRTMHLPVIMLSALGQEKDVQRALDYGANSYVSKPFSLRRLVAEVTSYLPGSG